MTSIKHELHHLNALATFEVAARHGNFTSAAKELFVTRVAVSRQIKILEDDLNAQLFKRKHRGVELTDVGRQLFETVSTSLRDIANTQHQIRSQQIKRYISVTMTAAFASFWLIPRMNRFIDQHPDIDLRLIISDQYLSLHTENIDAAIRWGHYDTADNLTLQLFPGAIIPVCSPEYLKRCDPIENPSDLLGRRLIYLDGSYREDAKWPDWFKQFGLKSVGNTESIFVDSYTNMIQAAISGQGIALGDIPLLGDLISEGSLVYAFDVKPVIREHFYFVTPPYCQNAELTELFKQWLINEVDTNTVHY